MNLSEVPEAAYYKALADAFRGSLYATAKHLLGMHEVNAETHGKMIRALEAQTMRKLIVMPRGTFKTSVASVAYPIWILLNDPNARIMLDSELYTNSKNRLREIKQHLESPLLIQLFGEFKTGNTWSESEILIRQRTKIFREASIFCSGIGASKTGVHCSHIVADDLNSANNSRNPENAQKIIDHYRFYTSILDPGGTIVIVGTRYSDSDLPGHLLREEITGFSDETGDDKTQA